MVILGLGVVVLLVMMHQIEVRFVCTYARNVTMNVAVLSLGRWCWAKRTFHLSAETIVQRLLHRIHTKSRRTHPSGKQFPSHRRTRRKRMSLYSGISWKQIAWHTTCGTTQPSDTAMLVGMLWMLKSGVFGVLLAKQQAKPIVPAVTITPVFGTNMMRMQVALVVQLALWRLLLLVAMTFLHKKRSPSE